jgi:transposase
MTATLGTSEDTKLTSWWLGFSHLKSGKARIQLPLAPSPYIKKVEDASRGILARKTKQGRWRFEVVDKKPWMVPVLPEDAPKVGVDVGLNVMAATSDGLLLGSRLKPKFNALYDKVKEVRANRQRQAFKDNSPRLDRLEDRLTGLVKTCAGEAANKLIKAYPGCIFVIEDLDLRGCKGQKRFAYRALHHSLEPKALCCKENAAFTSQPCPSCGYVSRRNRTGVKFHCRSCGRLAHADWVGGIGLLRRSEDKQIGLDDYPSEVGVLLRERFRLRRTSSSGRLVRTELKPISRKLTVKGSPKGDIRTASNPIQAHDQL